MFMKKFFFFAAAMMAAITVNAKVINIDLSQYVPAGGNADAVTPSLASDVLTVEYNFAEAWANGGVEFALANLEQIDSIAFDYKGDARATEWVSFQVYIKDSEGIRWYSAAADLCISSWVADWQSVCYMPSDVLWDPAPSYNIGERPFVAYGFLANPGSATEASFAIRNVRIYVPGEETAISNVASAAKAVKEIRNGQVVILRGDKIFNALGAEMK